MRPPTRISSLAEIQEYVLVSGPKGQFSIKEELRTAVAALEHPDKSISILVSAAQSGGMQQHGLMRRVVDAGRKIRTVYIGDGGMLARLYAETKLDAGADGQESSLQKALDELIELANAKDVSDIHIEIRDKVTEVKFRRLGKLVKEREWDVDYSWKFVRALHDAAESDSKQQTFSQAEGQAMAISRTLSTGPIKLRVQTLVAYPSGMDCVMRVLRIGKQTRAKELTALGYEKHHIEMLDYMLSRPAGVICVAGTTGSGKSTTLQTMMANMRASSPGAKLYSVEDPPEYVLPGVTQIPVVRRKDDKENAFAKAMRELMRADPDTVMVGEIRDSESAVCLVSMVQSGHKVLTTTHAQSAIDIVGRIKNMGIDFDTLTSQGFIAGLMYQTLLAVLCPACKEPYDPHKNYGKRDLHERLRRVAPRATIFFEGEERKKTCKKCGGMGVIGRTVCAELIIPDDTLLDHMRNARVAEAKRHWAGLKRRSLNKSGETGESMEGMSALDHALIKMRRGEVSPIEVEDALGLMTGYGGGEMEVLDSVQDILKDT